MFRNQVRRKRQQEQQDDLRCRLVTAPAAEEAQGAPVQPTDDKTSQDTANRHFEELKRCATNGKYHRPHRHGDGKLQRDQTGGVVHQRFALKDAHDFLRYAPLPHNAGKGNSIGWRKDGGQRKGWDKRYPRHQPVNHKSNADHRDQHQRQRKAEDLSPMLEKLTRWRLPAIGKEQRRDEQHQKQLRIEFHMQTKRRPRQQGADGDLH